MRWLVGTAEQEVARGKGWGDKGGGGRPANLGNRWRPGRGWMQGAVKRCVGEGLHPSPDSPPPLPLGSPLPPRLRALPCG